MTSIEKICIFFYVIISHGNWRCPRTSNPLAGSNKVRGEFDPHALPQCSILKPKSFSDTDASTFANAEASLNFKIRKPLRVENSKQSLLYLALERKHNFVSFRPKGEICKSNICVKNRFLTSFGMTLLLQIQ